MLRAYWLDGVKTAVRSCCWVGMRFFVCQLMMTNMGKSLHFQSTRLVKIQSSRPLQQESDPVHHQEDQERGGRGAGEELAVVSTRAETPTVPSLCVSWIRVVEAVVVSAEMSC